MFWFLRSNDCVTRSIWMLLMLLMPWFDRKRRTLGDTGHCIPPSRLGCCHPTGTPLTNPYHFFRVSIKNRNSPTQPYLFFLLKLNTSRLHLQVSIFSSLLCFLRLYDCLMGSIRMLLMLFWSLFDCTCRWLGDTGHSVLFLFRVSHPIFLVCLKPGV